MKTALLISIAALTAACNGPRQPHTDNASTPGTASSPNAATSATSTKVTLVGCLQGPSSSRATGTAGTTAGGGTGAPATGIDATETQKHGAAQSGPFILANAAVESGGIGANGAGASGGPAANAGSSFELDGVPADAQASVNKRVRVTGRMDTRAAGTTGAPSGSGATRDAGATAAPSTTGETSPRDDVRANSTGVAGDSTNHRLTVETVEVVAQQCGPQ